MSLRARLAAVGAAAITLEATLGAVVLLVAGPTRIALYLIVCATATALVLALLWKLLDGPPGGPDDGDGGGGGDDPPPPPWWPEFEREFRRHVRERGRGAPLG